jgi:hypothetical protein
MTTSKELVLVNRDEKGEVESITVLSNSLDRTRNFVLFSVSKLSFDELEARCSNGKATVEMGEDLSKNNI